MAQPSGPHNFIDQIVTALANHIGLNGVSGVQQSNQRPSQPAAPKRIDPDQLRKQGWSEADIRYMQAQEARNGGGS